MMSVGTPVYVLEAIFPYKIKPNGECERYEEEAIIKETYDNKYYSVQFTNEILERDNLREGRLYRKKDVRKRLERN